MRFIFKLILVILPWPLRRYLLITYFNYHIHYTAKIGLSFIYPEYLEMGPNSTIDHFNVAINLDKIILGNSSKIGRSNWITGFTTYSKSIHFDYQNTIRKSILLIGNHSAITKNHHLDCTNQITIGNFTTIAGYRSQFLTHSINILEGRQDSNPIIVGDYCFISTNVVVLGGATLPSYSILGAKALFNKTLIQEYSLYAGVPAGFIKNITKESKYFNRKIGFVY